MLEKEFKTWWIFILTLYHGSDTKKSRIWESHVRLGLLCSSERRKWLSQHKQMGLHLVHRSTPKRSCFFWVRPTRSKTQVHASHWSRTLVSLRLQVWMVHLPTGSSWRQAKKASPKVYHLSSEHTHILETKFRAGSLTSLKTEWAIWDYLQKIQNV